MAVATRDASLAATGLTLAGLLAGVAGLFAVFQTVAVGAETNRASKICTDLVKAVPIRTWNLVLILSITADALPNARWI